MGEALDLDEGRSGTHVVGRDRGSITESAVKPKAKLVALTKEYYKYGTYGNCGREIRRPMEKTSCDNWGCGGQHTARPLQQDKRDTKPMESWDISSVTFITTNRASR